MIEALHKTNTSKTEENETQGSYAEDKTNSDGIIEDLKAKLKSQKELFD